MNRKFFLRILFAGVVLNVGFVVLAVSFVVGFIVWRVNLAHEVNTELASTHASGLPVNGLDLNTYYPAVPENENAALVMTQAFKLMQNYPDSRSNEMAYSIFPKPNQRLTPGQKKLFSGYVEMNADALAKMREAYALPKSRYPINYTPGPSTPLPHLAQIHNLGKVVMSKSFLASESGDTTNATAGIEDLLQMGQTLDQEPDLISQLVRISLVAMAKNSLEHCLNVTSLNETELAALASAFSAGEKTNLMARALAGELGLHVPIFIRVNSNATDARELVEGAQQVGGFSTPKLDAWLIRDPRFFEIIGFWDRDLLYYLDVLKTNVPLDRYAPPQTLAVGKNFKKTYEAAEQGHFYLSKLLLSDLSGAVIRQVDNFAFHRLSITAIAIERFRLARGRLPENLNKLVPQFLSAAPIDPFNGQPLGYHHLAKGYMLDSVGPPNLKPTDKNAQDFTFTVEQ